MTLSLERTPDGRRLCVAREIASDADAAWDILVDTDQWPAWGPSVSAVESDSRYIQSGTTGRVQVLGGPWLPFEVRTCRHRRWTWRVARIPATGHRVESVSTDRCRVVFEIPPLASGYAAVCDRALDRIESLLTDPSTSNRS